MSRPADRSSLRARLLDRLLGLGATAIEPLALPIDRSLATRTRVLDRIPPVRARRGGKRSYAEWAWVIGLLQALLDDLLVDVERPRVVDVGCGSGLVLIAAEPSVADGGQLIGLDVQPDAIEFCRRHYPDPPYAFHALPIDHPLYAPGVSADAASPEPWPVEAQSADLVTALSVLTHLDREATAATLAEVARVLRPGSPALLSVFLVDPDDAEPPDDRRPARSTSRFHRTDPDRWRFVRPIGHGWFAPSWSDPPERAIGLTRTALDRVTGEAGLAVERVIPGTWREERGLYFQDLVIVRRSRP